MVILGILLLTILLSTVLYFITKMIDTPRAPQKHTIHKERPIKKEYL